MSCERFPTLVAVTFWWLACIAFANGIGFLAMVRIHGGIDSAAWLCRPANDREPWWLK